MRTLLIDDHPLILAALQTVIRGLRDDVELVIVETAQLAREALAADATFDLVLLDLHLSDADGFDLLVELRQAYPALSVVVVSASDQNTHVVRAIELGAMGFVPKRASSDVLLKALSMVMSGGIYVPPMSMRSALTDAPANEAGIARSPRLDGAVSSTAAGGTASLAAIGFTPRQTDVLALLLRGLSNKLIARELNLSVETIKDHVAAVLRTLKVSSRTQAVLAVSQMQHRGVLPAWGQTPAVEATPNR